MSIDTKILVEPSDDERKDKILANIGIYEECLKFTLRQGQAERNNSTKNDRHNDAGNRASSAIFRNLIGHVGCSKTHCNMNSVLPEELRPFSEGYYLQGWEKTVNGHIESIFNSNTGNSIIPYAGNKDTGISIEIIPETAHKRGRETILPIRRIRNQDDLFYEAISPNYSNTDETWILLYYYDEMKSEYRYELSLSKTKNAEKGYINDWKERLIFNPLLPSESRIISSNTPPDNYPNFDPPVKRRSK